LLTRSTKIYFVTRRVFVLVSIIVNTWPLVFRDDKVGLLKTVKRCISASCAWKFVEPHRSFVLILGYVCFCVPSLVRGTWKVRQFQDSVATLRNFCWGDLPGLYSHSLVSRRKLSTSIINEAANTYAARIFPYSGADMTPEPRYQAVT
jgi:hypothetical protein